MAANSKSKATYPVRVTHMVIVPLLLAACAPKATCDDPTVTAKMLTLAEQAVVIDLADQCSAKLYGSIPAVSVSCSTARNDGHEKCQTACKVWARSAVTSNLIAVTTTFTDDTIATTSCRASVRFDVAYDDGQQINAAIAYLVARRNGGIQVALSQ